MPSSARLLGHGSQANGAQGDSRPESEAFALTGVPARSVSDILGSLEVFGVRLGLETTNRLLDSLGHPEDRLASVLVAGTNGKGSTAALLAAMSSAAGYRTGLYTSPHLEDVSERIRIDGRVIPGPSLHQYLIEVVEVAERALGHLPTYFEALTAVAFRYFAEEGVELAILEVGLGGRLDATNTVSPVLSLLTEIGLEHRDHLGETVQDIAQEKAGIFRPKRPAVAWVQRRGARIAIEEVAKEQGVELRMGPELAEIRSIEELGWQGQRIRLQTAADDYCSDLSLLGRHQAANFALAVLGAEILAGDRWSQLDCQAIERGASIVRWPGRLERVELSPSSAVLLDAAHNADGVVSLLQFLDDKGLRFDLLFGTLADKEVEQILPPMVQRAEQVTLTAPTSDRALSPERLAELVKEKQPRVEPVVELALRRALDAEQELVVGCGSVYLVGELRSLLRREFGVPGPATAPLYHQSGS